MTDVNGVVEFKDFFYDPQPKRFKLGPDMFEAAADLPLGILDDVKKLTGVSFSNAPLEAISSFLRAVLLPESADRFIARFNDKANPIGISAFMMVMNWLLEEYGLRPTQPSSPSSTGSQEDSSTSSTDGAESVASILGASDSPAS